MGTKRRYTAEEIIGKLRELEKENLQLKKLVANLSLDNVIQKEVLGKKWPHPTENVRQSLGKWVCGIIQWQDAE